MDKIKILISGCNGHMGQVLKNIIDDSSDLEVVAGFDKDENTNFNFPVLTSLSSVCPGKDIELPNVIIDFSSPEAVKEIIKFADKWNIPIVIATTGITEETQKEIELLSKKIPVFQSANMSYEVCLLKNILQLAATKLKNVDIEILERHHNRKKDAPSGTALMLANAINKSLDNSMEIVYGRDKKRESNEIGISSIRGGNLAGVHEVSFYGKYEDLSIIHTSHSRDVFAEGSIIAANWLLKKEKPGLYNMDDLFED